MIRIWLFVSLLSAAAAAAPAGRLPLRFEPSAHAGFVARAPSGSSYISRTGALRLTPELEMQFAGGARSPRAFPSEELSGKSNDLRGSDRTQWRTGIPQYGRLRFAQIWSGIDVIYHGDESRLEYDFVVAPGASTDTIVLSFRAAESVLLSPTGDLLVRGSGNEFCFHAPRVLQAGKLIDGRYSLLGGNRVGFRVGRYDRTRPLLIDPVLGYAALFGSHGSDPVQSVAVDAAGNVYIAGTTTSEVPLVNPLQSKQNGSNCSGSPGNSYSPCEDVFVAKFDATGTKLLYSTYLGGEGRDFAAGIAVDPDGNIFVAGTTKPPYTMEPNGQAWVMKLNPTGAALLYNRTIGGITAARGIGVDPQGNAYLAGTSFASDFPAVHALQARTPLNSLFVTSDGGATWRSLSANLPALTVNSLAIDPTRPQTLYAATTSGLYKSLDAGASWTRLLPAAVDANQIVVDPKTPSILYVVYSPALPLGRRQVAKSIDAGLTWQVAITLSQPNFFGPFRQFGALAIDPANPSTVWLSDTTGRNPAIYRSSDGGVHWSDRHDFPAFSEGGAGTTLSPDSNASGILIDPRNSSRVYVCCAYRQFRNQPSFFRTDDGGISWVEVGPNSGNGLWPPVLDPRDGSSLYASHPNGVWHGTEAGQVWTTVDLPASAPILGYNSGSLVIDPSGALSLLYDDGLLLRSSAGGANWTTSQGPWTKGARILALDPANPATTMYVGSPGTGGTMETLEHAFAAKLDSAGSVVWATLIAGSQQDEARAIAVDSSGNAYVAGRTNSRDFPLAHPAQGARGKATAMDIPFGSGFDAFLTKISSDGSTLLYSTYLGASGDDAANAVALDSGGNAYLAGSTGWTDFPTVNAIQTKPGNVTGASFVAKFDSTGQKLVFSTYLTGTGDNPTSLGGAASSIAVDAQGAAWVAGHTGSADFPLVDPIQPSIGANGAAYLAQLKPSGQGMVLGFSTYLGGTASDTIAALAAAPGGSLWMVGAAPSPDFFGGPPSPTPGGFLARLDPDRLPAGQPGVPLVRSLYNAASLRLGDVVSPGELVTLYGEELAAGTGSAGGYPLPRTLRDVSVTIGGLSAPLFYVSPGQINFQAPFELPSGATTIVVKRGSQSSVARSVRVIPLSPGIFTVPRNGVNLPVILHTSDYSQVTPENPARAGEYLAIFCTGLGITGANARSGDAAPSSLSTVQARVDVVVESRPTASVPYAGLAPGYAGVYQVNFLFLGIRLPGPKLLYLSVMGVVSNLVSLYVE